MTFKLNKRGFTLIELLVVIAIIAILAALGLVAYSSAQRSARDAQRMSTVRDIASYMEQEKVENGVYPTVSSVPTELQASSIGSFDVPADPSDKKLEITSSTTSTWCIQYELEQTSKGNCQGCSGGAVDGSGTGYACAANKL